MKRFSIALAFAAALLLSTGLQLRAADPDKLAAVKNLHIGGICDTARTFSMAYDAYLDFRFDNREFDKGDNYFTSSMTIFGMNFTPQIGLAYKSPLGGMHRLMVGVDLKTDFGAVQYGPVYRGMTIFYMLQKKISPKCLLEVEAGRFPRKMQKGNYNEAFISDSLRYERNTVSGLLVQFTRPHSYYEIGVDWIGRPEGSSRERFMIYGSADATLLRWLSLGGTGYMYHFAGSEQVEGVVDNILVQPWVKFDVASYTGFQSLAAKIGWLETAQQDRVLVHQYVFAGGPTLDLEIKRWNAFIRNHSYWGSNLMPYYNVVDAGGYKYSSNLYWGDPFYRTRANGDQWGFYDKLSIGWEPILTNWLSIAVKLNFHFTDRYEGTSQFVQLKFNLENLAK